MPLYAGMPWNDLELLDGVPDRADVVGRRAARVRVGKLPGSDVPIYFLEYNRYFDRPYLYGPPAEGYPDNLERFTFLSRGVAGAVQGARLHARRHPLQRLADRAGAGLRQHRRVDAAAARRRDHLFASTTSPTRAIFDGGGMFITGLGREHYNPREFEHFGAMNLTKGALHHSTLLSTVSPTYAREIQTARVRLRPRRRACRARSGDLRRHPQRHRRRRVEPGDGPQPAGALRRRRPRPARRRARRRCRSEAGLPVRPDVPLFGIVGRLTSQKGFDVLAHALARILSWDVQMVLLGTGDPDAERFFAWADAAPRRSVPRLARLRRRPRPPHRGGRRLLPDAVALRAVRPQPDVQPALRHAAGRARHRRPGRHRQQLRRGRPAAAPASCSTTSTRSRWRTRSAGRCRPGTTAPSTSPRMRQRAMAQDFSWERAAAAYRDLYLRAYTRRRGHPFL